MKELVSLIIPAYEIESQIEKCLESIKCQTYKNLEIIVVDDGSKDNTGNLCDKLAAKDCRVLVVHQDNCGAAEARNTGMALARGEYVCFVDGDDFLEPGYVESLIMQMQIPGVQMAVCSFQEEYEDGRHPRVLGNTQGIREAEKVLPMIFFHDEVGRSLWNKMFVRSVIQENNLFFQGEYLVGEDMLFLIQYLMKISRVAITDKVGYHYLWREGSAMQKRQWNSSYYKNRTSWIKALKAAEMLLHDQTEQQNIFQAYKLLVYYRILCESSSFQGNSQKKRDFEHALLGYVRKHGMSALLSKRLTFKTAIGVLLCCISPKLQVELAKIGRH